MARLTGLEPATPGVTGRYSNQLSYNRSPSATGNPVACRVSMLRALPRQGPLWRDWRKKCAKANLRLTAYVQGKFRAYLGCAFASLNNAKASSKIHPNPVHPTTMFRMKTPMVRLWPRGLERRTLRQSQSHRSPETLLNLDHLSFIRLSLIPDYAAPVPLQCRYSLYPQNIRQIYILS